MDDDKILAIVLLGIAIFLKPLFYLLPAQLRLCDCSIKVLHQYFLRKKGQITNSQIRQIRFLYTIATIIIPIKRRMVPDIMQKFLQTLLLGLHYIFLGFRKISASLYVHFITILIFFRNLIF